MRTRFPCCPLVALLCAGVLAACGGGGSTTTPAPQAGSWCSVAVQEYVCAAPGILPNGAWSSRGLPCPSAGLLRSPAADARAITGATTQTYEVGGATLAQVRDDIYTTSGPVDPETGVRYAATAQLEWQAQGTVTTRPNGAQEIHITGVTWSVTVALPHWEPSPGTPPQDVAAWQDFVHELENHEQGHVDRLNAGMTAVNAEATWTRVTIPAGSTEEQTNDAADAAVKATQAFADMEKSNQDYDAPYDAQTNPEGTNHGTENGQNARWGP